MARLVSLAVMAAALAAAAGSAASQPIKVQTERVQPAPELEEPALPPAGQDEAAPAKPGDCVTVNAGFRQSNGVNQYFVALTNSCARPQSCVVKAYVVGSEGGKTGRTTLLLPAAAKGQETHRTFTMRTAENGGMASMSRICTPQ